MVNSANQRHPENLRDVRMVQRREHFGFPLEARQTVRISGHGSWQHFDGDLALQVGVGRTIDFAPSRTRTKSCCRA